MDRGKGDRQRQGQNWLFRHIPMCTHADTEKSRPTSIHICTHEERNTCEVLILAGKWEVGGQR